jgi:P pilus assembly chaperone PapD
MFIICVMMLYHLTAIAQGDLLITPTRIVFEGKKQNQEIILVNTGHDTSTYNVSLVQNRVREDGSYERIEKPDSGQFFVDNYIRFFPRKFTLAPNEP